MKMSRIFSDQIYEQIFSSGETSKTQDSSNCSVGKGTSDGGPQSTRLIYLNERKQEKTEFKPKPKKMQRGTILAILVPFFQLPYLRNARTAHNLHYSGEHLMFFVH